MEHDIIIVGAGHAGIEAADAALRCGLTVALVTLDEGDFGKLSCNPAIGGIGKTHLVREIDALGGVIGRLGDRSAIHYRLLNRSKGPAVRGTRAQIDRDAFHREVRLWRDGQTALDVIYDEAIDLLRHGDRVVGVATRDGGALHARAVLLATGTFLGGRILTGSDVTEGGRIGERAATALGRALTASGLTVGRLKTGTPPRLDGRTIDWDLCDAQPSDEDPVYLSLDTDRTHLRQISCGITHTNAATHEIIEANLGRSALFGGLIEGKGPRYCPSVEDKVVRFAGKDSHQIFLEPESLGGHSVYPNGISTSLPLDVQVDFLRTINGLQNAEVLQPGYAVEYGYVDPRGLDQGLMVRTSPGLYLAGQINGTTGYEEASGQGLVAALSAAADLRGVARPRFSRTSSYLGVMIDDLTTTGVTEPYRVFTSRSEHRLVLRPDNAEDRLWDVADRMSLWDEAQRAVREKRREMVAGAASELRGHVLSDLELSRLDIARPRDGRRISAFDALGRTTVSWDDLAKAAEALDLMAVPPFAVARLEAEALYGGYIDRSDAERARARQNEEIELPSSLDLNAVPGLSIEAREAIGRSGARTIGQVARLEGITPSAIAALLASLRKLDRAA